jgi:hypothetical protein
MSTRVTEKTLSKLSQVAKSVNTKRLVYAIDILIQVLILKYLFTLEKEKCSCAKTWHFQLVKFGSSVVITYMLVDMVTDLGYNLKSFFSAFSIVYVFVLAHYAYTMSRVKCACAKGRRFVYVQIYAYVAAFFLLASMGVFTGVPVINKIAGR